MLQTSSKVAAFLGLLLLGGATRAHDLMSLDELLGAFGWDFASAEVRTQKLGDGFYVLFGIGGNVAVSVGRDGVLIVDDQFPQMMPKIKAAIADVGGAGVDFVVNTHWHFDHAEGNLTLGPEGAAIVSQANSRAMMLDDHVINLVAMQYLQKAYPASALPSITFDNRMQLHFNGEQIDLLHFGPAHTTGDTAVIFRGQNAVHFGDVFNNTGYPFIDADNGGEIDGIIRFCEGVLAEINAQTRVIPGHGEVTDYAGLKTYTDMLKVVRDRIAVMVADGKTLDEVVAVRPTAEFDAAFGDPAQIINRAYASLARER